MERMQVEIFNRDFTPRAPSRLQFAVERLSWKAQGGPAVAFLHASTQVPGWGSQAAQWARDALRCPVVVTNQAGENSWWGYIQRVEVRYAGLRLSYDLGELANRVCVEYFQRQPQLEWSGVKTFTPWADDSASQRIYGVKERIFRLGSLDERQALQTRDALLAAHGQPQARPASDRGAGDEIRVRLECRGWWETLDWKIARFDDGYEGFVKAAPNTQYLGRSTADARLAQSFQTAAGGWKLGEAVVNLRGAGVNNDNLRCEVCASAGNLPGEVLASAEVSASGISGARWWVRFVFEQRPQIDAGAPYWLVLSRTGNVNSVNYFQVYIDNTNAYPAGRLVIWNGSSWVETGAGLVDINFYVVGYVPRTTRLSELAAVERGGQFLTGLRLKPTIDGDTLLWRPGALTCQEEIEALLQTGGADGSRLLAQVEADRRLVVFSPDEDLEGWFSLDSSGELKTRSGRAALSSDRPAGKKLLPDNGWFEQPFSIEEVEWTPAGGLRAKI